MCGRVHSGCTGREEGAAAEVDAVAGPARCSSAGVGEPGMVDCGSVDHSGPE
jgi:hypothetical protein